MIQRYTTRYIKHLRERKCTTHTIEGDTRRLRKFTRWLNARNYSLIDLTEEDIRGFQRHLEKTLKPATVRGILSTAKGLYRWMVKESLILDDPFKNYKHGLNTNILPVVISEETYIELINSLPESTTTAKRNKALLELAYSSLLRREELVNLKLTDINFDERLLQVVRKGDKEAVIPFGQCAREAMLDYIQTERENLLKGKVNSYLWLNRWGNRLHYDSMDKIIASVRKSTGIDFDWHTLRRSGATHMLKRGASMLTIQKMLSHANLETVKHYLKLDVKDLIETHDKVEGLQ